MLGIDKFRNLILTAREDHNPESENHPKRLTANSAPPGAGGVGIKGKDELAHVTGPIRALQAPVKQIAENAGGSGDVVAGKLLESKDYKFGYDAQNEEYTDMITAGIIDPTKVVRTALQYAASIAGLLITTEAMVAEKPEPKPAMPAAPDMGGMGGMM